MSYEKLLVDISRGRFQRSATGMEQRDKKNTAKLQTQPPLEVGPYQPSVLPKKKRLAPKLHSHRQKLLLRLCAAQPVLPVQTEPKRHWNDSGAAWPAHTCLTMTLASNTATEMLVVSKPVTAGIYTL
jgi:hypothetical protein